MKSDIAGKRISLLAIVFGSMLLSLPIFAMQKGKQVPVRDPDRCLEQRTIAEKECVLGLSSYGNSTECFRNIFAQFEECQRQTRERANEKKPTEK